MKKLILILLSISFCLLCNAETYTYTGQNYHANTDRLLTVIEADAAFAGVVFSYINYYGEDIDNCSYDITTDIALDASQQTTLANLISTYNVSGWAEITALLIYEYYAKVA